MIHVWINPLPSLCRVWTIWPSPLRHLDKRQNNHLSFGIWIPTTYPKHRTSGGIWMPKERDKHLSWNFLQMLCDIVSGWNFEFPIVSRVDMWKFMIIHPASVLYTLLVPMFSSQTCLLIVLVFWFHFLGVIAFSTTYGLGPWVTTLNSELKLGKWVDEQSVRWK